MNLAKYCKEKGMSLEEFLKIKEFINNTALKIARQEKEKNNKLGLFYPIENIIPNSEFKCFIIKELKKKYLFDFRENNSLYRP